MSSRIPRHSTVRNNVYRASNPQEIPGRTSDLISKIGALCKGKPEPNAYTANNSSPNRPETTKQTTSTTLSPELNSSIRIPSIAPPVDGSISRPMAFSDDYGYIDDTSRCHATLDFGSPTVPNVSLPKIWPEPVVRLVRGRDTVDTRACIPEICNRWMSTGCLRGSTCYRVHPRRNKAIPRLRGIVRVEFVNRDDVNNTIPNSRVISPEPKEFEMSPLSEDPVIRFPTPKLQRYQFVAQKSGNSQYSEPLIVTHGDKVSTENPMIQDFEDSNRHIEYSMPGGWAESTPSESGESSSSGWDYQPSCNDWMEDSSNSTSHEEIEPPCPIIKHPRPPNADRCRNWLRGFCDRGYDCIYVHDDLEYEDEREPATKKPVTPPPPQSVPTKFPQSSWTFPMHDHMKVKMKAGFTVEEIVTGFETPWVLLDQIPSHVSIEEIRALISRYGQPVDLKIVGSRISSAIRATVRFSSHAEARDAASSINGSRHFGAIISAHLPIHTGGRGAEFRDTSVRITWEAPGTVGYGGYPTRERADAAIAECHKGPLGDSYVWGTIHRGLPAVSAFTVKFQNLPLNVTKDDMKRFAPVDMMWDQPNYRSLTKATDFIKKTIDSQELLDFDVLPPPYRSGRVLAFAQFSTPAAARAAANMINGRQPTATGRTRVYAHHLQTLRYTIPPELFTRRTDDLRAFQESVRRRPVTFANLHIEFPKLPSSSAVVKLSADNIRELGRLKAELECVLRGEVLRQEGTNVWNGYFVRTAGIMFLHELQTQLKGLIVERDFARRTLTLFGSIEKRQEARQRILSKVKEIQMEGETHSISLHRVPIGLFMTKHYINLQKELGAENLSLDVWSSNLIVQGSLDDFEIALREVQTLEKERFPYRANAVQCPICFNEVAIPFGLHCGHSYCRACLINYMVAAIDTKFFPLTCVGDEGRCSEPIPLSIGRRFLTVPQFDMVVNAAFKTYVYAHPKELHYCPTPDCLQVYRSAPPGTVLQCPSCLLRICPQCHVEYHDGFSCPDRSGGDELFDHWAKSRDVKCCPGCKIAIERAEGCNHVTCIRCQTHICWVCMETFPRGEGIYGHMREEHGGFGLEPING